MKVTFANWLIAYRREWLRADIVAGLTTAAVVIPQSMAYAVIAGLPVETGSVYSYGRHASIPFAG